MITAFDALKSIEQASLGLRADEDRLARIIETSASEIARLRAEQAELFKSLARIRLDTLLQDRVIGPLDEAERKALAVVKDQKQKREALSKRSEALLGELAAARGEREAKAEAVSQAADAITALTEATEKRIADDVAWQAQAARLAGAQARAQAAEEKALRSEADRDEKSKPYLADRLFVYLWGRGYGTSAYRGGAFARFGDGYVARVVNYEPARQNYFTLTEIPKRLREHADRLKTEVAEEEEKLAALERAVTTTVGCVAPRGVPRPRGRQVHRSAARLGVAHRIADRRDVACDMPRRRRRVGWNLKRSHGRWPPRSAHRSARSRSSPASPAGLRGAFSHTRRSRSGRT